MVVGNHEYIHIQTVYTDSINSVRSSHKSHLFLGNPVCDVHSRTRKTVEYEYDFKT